MVSDQIGISLLYIMLLDTPFWPGTLNICRNNDISDGIFTLKIRKICQCVTHSVVIYVSATVLCGHLSMVGSMSGGTGSAYNGANHRVGDHGAFFSNPQLCHH